MNLYRQMKGTRKYTNISYFHTVEPESRDVEFDLEKIYLCNSACCGLGEQIMTMFQGMIIRENKLFFNFRERTHRRYFGFRLSVSKKQYLLSLRRGPRSYQWWGGYYSLYWWLGGG